jgi:hypothetical protein
VLWLSGAAAVDCGEDPRWAVGRLDGEWSGFCSFLVVPVEGKSSVLEHNVGSCPEMDIHGFPLLGVFVAEESVLVGGERGQGDGRREVGAPALASLTRIAARHEARDHDPVFATVDGNKIGQLHVLVRRELALWEAACRFGH